MRLGERRFLSLRMRTLAKDRPSKHTRYKKAAFPFVFSFFYSLIIKKNGMTSRYQYHQGDDVFSVASMRKYLDEKQEMDKLLDTLIAPFISGQSLRVLDAGCGVGHSLFFLRELSPESEFFGVDQTPVYISEAEKLFASLPNLSFAAGNVEDLPAKFPKAFDVSLSRAVISWMPYYDEFVKALLAVTKKHVFISSLFYEGDVDFLTTVKMYKGESGVNAQMAEERRNVYSLPRFTRFVTELGAKGVTVADFDMPIDLPRPPLDRIGTYTVRLENGKRLQLSGAVLMNWKWVRIDL